MKTAIYLRQSLDRAGDMLAVDRQREDCLKLCGQRGWTNVAEYQDNDRSATNGKPRPDYLRMIADIRDGKIERVVAWHQDRLHRDVRELLAFAELAVEHDLKLATVTGDIDLATDDGEFMATIGAALARKETRRKSARQKRAAKQLAEDGGRPWWPSRPFGYDADPDKETGKWWTAKKNSTAVNEIRLNRAEADLLRDAYTEVLAGSSLRSVATQWNAAGITTPKGNEWRGAQVRELLLNPRNAGLRTYRGEIVGEASWPAIVDRDVFDGVRAILTEPERRIGSGGRKHLLSGIALCGKCSHTMGSAKTTKTAGARLIYACKSCHRVTRDMASVDEFIEGIVVERLSRPDAADLLIVEKRDDINELRDRAAALRARQDEAAGMYADGTVTATQLKIVNAKLAAQLSEIESKMLDANRTRVFDGVIGAPNPRVRFDGLSLDRRRAIVDALMTVTIVPTRRGQHFDPEAVHIEWCA